jgi:D-alanyl-D-alanine carboxypeptidase (penicillin-binding protein 5/6)
VNARVWQGSKTEIPLGLTEDLYVTVPTGQYKKLQASIDLSNPLQAPIIKGQVYGTLNILIGDQTIASKPLIALTDNPKGGIFRRASDSVKYNIHKYFSRDEKTTVNAS